MTFGASVRGTGNFVPSGCCFAVDFQLTAIAPASFSMTKISSFDACADTRNVIPDAATADARSPSALIAASHVVDW